jgi:uncharacterized protein YbjT (DUF2867 family)
MLVHTPSKAEGLGDEVELVIGDLDRPERIKDAFAGVRALYLISTAKQVDAVIEVAKRAGVEHIVRQSTLEAGFDPPIGPGQWHREAEQTIEHSGLAYTHLRPTMMMVNTLSWWAPNIVAREVVFFPGGEGRLSPVDPRDIASVAAAVLTQAGHEGKAYEVTGPQLLSFGDMVATISRTIGKDLRYIDVPEAEAGGQMVKFGMQPEVVAGILETMAGVRADKFAYITDTLELLTSAPGRTWKSWCHEHKKAFMPATS